MEESPKIINIQDLSLLKITKVKTRSIYFDYDRKHYLLHGTYDDYESVHTLYEININKKGFWTLDFIKSDYARTSVLNEYIKPLSWKTIVYNQINKEYFVEKLAVHGFIKPNKIIDKLKNKHCSRSDL